MLDLWERWIQFHELKIDSSQVEAPYIPLREILPMLLVHIDSGKSFKLISNDQAALRISEYKLFVDEGVLVFLIQYADQNVTDPSFMHLEKGELRTEPKLDGEGVAVSAHVAISLEPHDEVGIMYRLLLEEIPGLGRSRINPFLKSELKEVSKGHFEFNDSSDNNRTKKYGPVAEVLGTPSKELAEEFSEGVILQGIELVKFSAETGGFDEDGFYSEVSKHVKIIPEPGGAIVDILGKVRAKALDQGFDDIKIRYKRGSGKQKTATMGASQADLADALIVRDEKITSNEVLSQCMEHISESIAQGMKAHILKLRNN